MLLKRSSAAEAFWSSGRPHLPSYGVKTSLFEGCEQLGEHLARTQCGRRFDVIRFIVAADVGGFDLDGGGLRPSW